MSAFIFTEEQKMIRESAREFAQTEVVKYVPIMEETNRLSMELQKKAADLGFVGISAPVELGGSGLGLVERMILLEEISRVSGGFGISMMCSTGHVASLKCIDEIRDKYVIPTIKGEMVMCTAATDPAGSVNMTEWAPSAKLDGDEWVINCTKMFCTNSDVASSYIVYCKTEDNKFPTILVPKDTPGFESGHIEKKIGLNGNQSGTLVMTNVRVPKDYVVVRDTPFADANLTVCAVAIGLAGGVLDKTFEYTHIRTSAGKPLYSYQALAHKIADLYARLEACKDMAYNTASMTDRKDVDPADKDYNIVSMCKSFITRTCVEIAIECMQIYGGIGYCEDTGIARYVRDVLGTLIADCTYHFHEEYVSMLLK